MSNYRLQDHMLEALDDLDKLQNLCATMLEAWPTADDFDEVLDKLTTQPKAAARFDTVLRRTKATYNSFEADARKLGVDV